jgi:hypothetical protein
MTATIKEMSKIGEPRKRWTDEVEEFPQITGLRNWHCRS